MKKYVLIILCCLSMLIIWGCEDTNPQLAVQAGIDAIKAVTLSDEDVKLMAAQASQQSDAENTIAKVNSPYGKRLYRLVGNNYSDRGYDFNFKVYLSEQVNAFAMADGTIRIYSGLMDMMDDRELLFVLGHEMGHVVKKHIKKKIMLAYAASALRKGVASQENIAGDLARSGLGGFVQMLLNAQFSQEEERQADDYGLMFLKEKNRQMTAAVSALEKLATLGSGHSFLSSHPAPQARANRLQGKIDSPEEMVQSSSEETIIEQLKKLIVSFLE